MGFWGSTRLPGFEGRIFPDYKCSLLLTETRSMYFTGCWVSGWESGGETGSTSLSSPLAVSLGRWERKMVIAQCQAQCGWP